MPDPDPRGYELAYDEGVRALSQQQAVLDNFRTRAGTDPLSLGQVHRDLALHTENSYDANAGRRQAMNGYFQAASVLLAAEVILWIVDVATRA